MAEVANNAQVYNDSYGNSYSLDFSKGYNPDPRPDVSEAAYLGSRGLGPSWWNKTFRISGYTDWANGIDTGYKDYLDVYNNRWNSLQNTFDQYQELGYNPYYMDKVTPTAPGSSSGHSPQIREVPDTPLSQIGQTFGQLIGMMSAFNNLRQQQMQLDISDEELKAAQINNEYLPEYLKFRNFLAGNRGDLTKTQTNIAGLRYDYNALMNDVYHWAYGRPAGYMDLSQSITPFDYSNTFGAVPFLRNKNALTKEQTLAAIVNKYASKWAEWEDFSKELSHEWDVNEKANFAKLLENWNKEVANEGLNQDVLTKELKYKSKAFGLDKGMDYLSRLLGLAGQAAGLRTSAFQRQLSRRRENFFEDTSRLGNFGIMPGAEYFGNNW